MNILVVITQVISQTLVELMTLTGSLGYALIIFTLVIRSLLLPLTIPSIKAQAKIRDLKPELDKLKNKHGADKKALQLAQMELYQKYNINPLAGCLPQILQIAVLIVLYHALVSFLGQTEFNGVPLTTRFFWLDLHLPDTTYILPVLAGVTQLILSLMIAPGAEIKDVVPNKSKKKKVQEANVKEEDMAEMAASMQQQMLFIMPVMTGFIAINFPSGLALYWVITTLFSIVQQYFLSGPGGLVSYWQRAKLFFIKKQ
jgi:YidC/Oxa1 family membrane protein insertase